ncbi:MAG TPA: hypothetical protein VEH27_08515 [Methylomirabilota bacterium]|nr:hypothetical protein [Methylomirabilota bacterium]
MRWIALAALLLVVAVYFARSRQQPLVSTGPVAPAPVAVGSSIRNAAPHPSAEQAGTRIARVLTAEFPDHSHKLSTAELGDFLNVSKHSAASLAAAFDMTQDKEFLEMAARMHPDDPLIQAKVLMHNILPEEREKWTKALKQSDPNNSLPYLLAASDLVAKGDLNAALAEIKQGGSKQLNDYARATSLSLEEAYLHAGRNPAEAKAYGSSDVLLPHLAIIKGAASELAQEASRQMTAGNTAESARLLQGVWTVGNQFRDASAQGYLLTDLVGIAVENMALSRWPEGVSGPFGDPKQVAAENHQRRTESRELTTLVGAWMNSAPADNEVIAYYDRLRLFGERDAMNWLKARRPDLSNAE